MYVGINFVFLVITALSTVGLLNFIGLKLNIKYMKLRDEDDKSTVGLWYRYKAFIANCIMGNISHDTQNISYWRDKLFTNIITFFLPGCFIALIPGVAMSFLSGYWIIGVIDLIAFALILATILTKRFSITFRKVSFVVTLFCLSIALIIFLSLFGPGMVYLLSICVLTTIILPKMWGYISAFANLTIGGCCALILTSGIFDSPVQAYSIGAWIAVCSNLVFLSFVVVAVVSQAIEGLEKTLIKDVLLKEENEQVIRNLVHSEQRLLQAQALAHVGSWELNFTTNIALWSEEACRIYGLHTQDNIQSYDTWASFNHPDDNDRVMSITSEARKTFSNSGFFHRILRKDGIVRHLYSEARYEFDKDGQPIGMYGVAHDITELKVNQENLRRSNERFELVNEAAREGILDWDIVNDVTFWGNGFTEIFGYKPSEYHNHLLSDNIHPEDKDEAMAILQKNLDDPTKSTLYREFRFLKADRSIAYVQIRTVIVRNSNGDAIRAVSSIMDVSNLVAKSQAIEKQNVALREIAWIQSHVIRSPLASIMGLIELLKHKEEFGVDEEDLISKIQTAAANLDKVIHDVVRKTEAVEHTFEMMANNTVTE